MSSPADPGSGAWRLELQRLPLAQRRLALRREVANRAARFLSLPASDAGLPAGSWAELGFDSLRAVDFRNEMEDLLGVSLRSTLLFDHPDLDGLVAYLLTVQRLDGVPGPTAQIPAAGSCAEQNVVLCVGDSGTFGVGSSDPAKHAYPAVLQTLLQERTKRDWTVINCGSPGNNSRDVLRQLPAQCAEFRPRVVCVSVGANDFWTCPELLPEGLASDTIAHGEANLRGRIPCGPLLPRCPPHGITPDASSVPVARGPEWEPRHLRLPSSHDNLPVKWQSTTESQAHQREGWRRHAANDMGGALAEFELAFAAVPDDAQTRQMLVALSLTNGRSEAAREHLQWLLDSWTRDQDFWTGRSLAMAFSQSGRSQQAREVALAVLAAYPDDGLTWRCRAVSEFHLGLCEEASHSIEAAIRLLPDRWSYFWRQRILFRLGNVEEAIRTIYAAYVVWNDAKVAAEDLRAVPAKVADALLWSLLESMACEPEVRARLAQIVGNVLVAKNGAAAEKVLSEHLRRIVALARQAGAIPVFVSYFIAQLSDDVMRTIAAELGVAFVAVVENFRLRVAPRPMEEVKSPDGHCNDEGYRIVATIVAEGLQEILADTWRESARQ